MNLTFEEYQRQAAETAVYPSIAMGDLDMGPVWVNYIYPTIGLAGEAGEFCEKIKKIIRDDKGEISDEKRKALAGEVGDLCWYISAICKELNLDMGEVAQANLDKLASRKARGTLQGSGDNR